MATEYTVNVMVEVIRHRKEHEHFNNADLLTLMEVAKAFMPRMEDESETVNATQHEPDRAQFMKSYSVTFPEENKEHTNGL